MFVDNLTNLVQCIADDVLAECPGITDPSDANDAIHDHLDVTTGRVFGERALDLVHAAYLSRQDLLTDAEDMAGPFDDDTCLLDRIERTAYWLLFDRVQNEIARILATSSTTRI